jgi:hypothetical protein
MDGEARDDDNEQHRPDVMFVCTDGVADPHAHGR